MRKLFISILTVISISSYSQINFESGYFINDDDQKTDCLIKNVDWKDNPTEFQYKLSGSEEILKGTIQSVKEFGVTGASKYIRATVKLDRSSDDLSALSTERNPSFQEERLFLKVLIEGKASLCIYEDGNLTRFFYKMDGSDFSQLVYKKYITRDNKLANNTYFRQQLFNVLSCKDIGERDVKAINYKSQELERLFIKYNKCIDPSYVQVETAEKKNNFHLSLRPRFNINSLSLQGRTKTMDTDFDTEVSLKLGAEAEFILPFNNGKWAVIIEPSIQGYKSETPKPGGIAYGGVYAISVNYKSIEIPVGLRHYFFLKNDAKFFLNASFLFDISNNSSVDFLRADGSTINSLDVVSTNSLAFGAGFSFKNKFGFELRYQTSREILENYADWSSDYKTLGIIFSYRLL